MIIAILVVYGLALGSFVNALVWRVHEQFTEAEKKKPSTGRLKKLSIIKGRSMCSSCGHELAVKDLIPVVSWLWLRGKCRYCRKPIPDHPLVEVATAALFVASYVWWPEPLQGSAIAVFVLWLALIVGFAALTVYDLRWMLLPDRIVFPLTGLAAIQALIMVANADNPLRALLSVLAAVAVGGGIFYLLYQLSDGKWIGGGDVKLGWLLGLTLGSPEKALLCIFLAALLGTVASVPMLLTSKADRKTLIPFGPFLIAGAIIAQLFGTDMINWYGRLVLGV